MLLVAIFMDICYVDVLVYIMVDIFHVEWYAAKAKREWLKHCLRALTSNQNRVLIWH